VTARAFAALLAVLAVALLPPAREATKAQSPPPGQSNQPPPTFSSRADAVWLTVFVTDEAGRPVRGLTVDDFEVLEKGQPRDVTTFQAVDLPMPPVRETLTGVETDVRTNENPPGRVWVFVNAIPNHCMADRARVYIKEFLTNYFGPDDIGTVVNLAASPGIARRRIEGQDFTGSVRLLSEAVDNFSADHSCSGSTGVGQVSSEAFRSLVEILSKMEGRHKTMVYFSSNALFGWLDDLDYSFERKTKHFDDLRTALSLTTRADLTIYPIDPRGVLSGMESRMELRAMARSIGGFTNAGTNYFSRTFERIAVDTSSFYSLGFNSGYVKDDGRYVDVEVRVKRTGLKVRTREGYVPLTARQRQEYERRYRTPPTAVFAALASPVATHAGMPLRVNAVSFRRPGALAQIALTVETDASAMSFVEKGGVFNGRIDLRHLATDSTQQLFPEIRGRREVTLDRDAHARASEHGMRFVSVFDAPPGRYQLRVAAESSGRTGSVVYDLDVPDFHRERFTLSGLALSTAGSALAPTVLLVTRDAQMPVTCRVSPCSVPKVVDSSWQSYADAATSVRFGKASSILPKVLPGPPTTVRQFATADVLSLYAEAYDNRSARTRSHEGAMVVTTTIYNAQNRVVAQTIAESQSPAPASGGITYPVRSTLPLARLGPGAYVAEVALAPYGKPDAAVTRNVPFEVR
jgi:VWFA-related protein